MTDLSIDLLKRLLAEERRNLPEMQWTYKGADASSIHHDYPSKHEEIYGVKAEMEVIRHSPLTPALAEEAIRLRGRIEGLILEMETKAANNEWQDPATIASYLKEIVLGDHDD
ncbi:hypothetical protein [Corynebacterium aurimucosum]|uniref:hypothetical protein n=1 Tax=Corynebacterium aurimucosum TaxID=169292 RepID=UPI003990728A